MPAAINTNRPVEWAEVQAVFDTKARRWKTKGIDVVVIGDDCPLDAYVGIRLEPGSCFIDLGCGNGKAIRKLADCWTCGTAVLVDASPGMLAEARRKLSRETGVRKVFLRADAKRDPLAGLPCQLCRTTASSATRNVARGSSARSGAIDKTDRRSAYPGTGPRLSVRVAARTGLLHGSEPRGQARRLSSGSYACYARPS
jgi:SAM-dependent methyltransferase